MNASVRSVCSCVLALVFALASSGCHDVGDVKVLSLNFDGVQSFRAGALKKVLATRSSGWLPWSRKYYFDRAEFDADLERIIAFYNDRGFPDARVTGVNVDFNAAKDGVRLRIGIEEGAPVIVKDVRYEGLDVIAAHAQEVIDNAPLKIGGRRDRDLIRQTRDQIATVFRNNGYPFVTVLAKEETTENGAGDVVVVTYVAEPGRQMAFGDARVNGHETLEEKVIRREFAFNPGELYDERRIRQTQRRLARLEFLDLAVVTPRLDEANDGQVPVAVVISEGKPRRLRLGAGYGSEELARVSASWQHLNFGGGAKLASVHAKWSSIDRGVALELVDPHAWRSGLSSRFTLSGWRTDQLTYDTESYGGTAGLAFQTDEIRTRRSATNYRIGLMFGFERLLYGIKPEFLADQSLRDERIALGLDPDTGRASGRLATIQLDFQRLALDNPADPTRGTALSSHVEFAAPWLGGTYKYTEVGGSARAFMPLGPLVLAGRVHASAISPDDPTLVPFSKRYFLGGANNLRGWNRFEVSPLDVQGRPIGGYSVVDFSGELRIPMPNFDRIDLVPFVDAGNVWSSRQAIDLGDLRWAAGLGIGIGTPIGPLRVDFAAQINPIPNLLINGETSTRRWRIHFHLGHIF